MRLVYALQCPSDDPLDLIYRFDCTTVIASAPFDNFVSADGGY